MPESLRLFALCQAMEWNHLPVVGGLYDQHPQVLEEWVYIFQRKHLHEKQQRDKHEAEMKRRSKR